MEKKLSDIRPLKRKTNYTAIIVYFLIVTVSLSIAVCILDSVFQ